MKVIVTANMSALRVSLFAIASAVFLFAADPPWKGKAVPDWTPEDARQILTDSPWAKTVRVTVIPLQTEDQRREGGNMGQEHGIGFDGLTDDRPREKVPKNPLDLVKPETAPPPPHQFVTVHLRWERALPIRVAEMKAGMVDPPTTGEDGYSIAVYGIPPSHAKDDPVSLGEPLKKMAFLRREGKKDVKPTSVEVFEREDGLVVVYLFPLSAEISKSDVRVEFDAQIGRVGISHSFDVEQMRFQGKLEM